MDPITNTIPITYDFLVSSLGQHAVTASTAESAIHILEALKDTPDLTQHPLLHGHSNSEMNLLQRIVRHHQQPTVDPQEQIELDWECLSYWLDKKQMAQVRQIYLDNRLLNALQQQFERVLLGKDSSQARTLDQIITGCETFYKHIRELFGPDAAQAINVEVNQFINSLIKTVFQSHYIDAINRQKSMSNRGFSLSIERFVECRAALKRIQEVYGKEKLTYDDNDDSLSKRLLLLILEDILQSIIPKVCPELNTTQDVQAIVTGYSHAWDGKTSDDQQAVPSRKMKIWLGSFIDHFLETVESKTTSSADVHHWRSIIYQMRRGGDTCINRLWYEWHQVIMLYWNYILNDDEERMDWIAMDWKQDFLASQVQILLTAEKPGVELEIYLKNAVIYDPLMHLGTISDVVAYGLHDGPGTCIPPSILFKSFFESVDSCTLNDWAAYALRVCPATRMQYGIPPYSSELLRSRIARWLSGDGPNGDLKHLPYTGTIDDNAVRHQLSQWLGRHIQGAEFRPLKPHIASLRYFLEPYLNDPNYPKTEAHILSCLIEIQNGAPITTDGQSPHEQILRLATNLHEDYVRPLVQAAEPLFIEKYKQMLRAQKPEAQVTPEPISA